MNESETLQTIRSKLVQKGISNPYLISGLLEHRRLFDYFKLEEDVISAVFKARSPEKFGNQEKGVCKRGRQKGVSLICSDLF